MKHLDDNLTYEKLYSKKNIDGVILNLDNIIAVNKIIKKNITGIDKIINKITNELFILNKMI